MPVWRSKVVLGVLVVAGCQVLAPVQRLPDLRFDHLLPIRFDVSSVEMISRYEPPFKPPHVEHLMPFSPERAARQWARDRLKAEGASGRRVVFIIRQAAVIEKQLAIDTGLTAYFKKQQSKHYDAYIDVLLEIRDENGRILGEVTAVASRSRTVGEGITPNEQDRIWQDIVRSLVTDMGSTLEEMIHQFLARYLVNLSA